MADILLLGATGFTGTLTARYLKDHRSRSRFTFALAARSKDTLVSLSNSLAEGENGLRVPYHVVDVQDETALTDLLPKFRVVMNLAGNYWKTGTSIVRICAENGVHYLDLTGELPWVIDIISRFDKRGPPKRSVIVPSCGFECIPSDVVAFSSVQMLRKTYGDSVQVGSSVTVHEMVAFISRGTLTSGVSLLEDIPRDKFWQSLKPYSVSPLQGSDSSFGHLTYTLEAHPAPIYGALFLLGGVNRALVNRTWGLFQATCSKRTSSIPSGFEYGLSFTYAEYIAVPSRFLSVATSIISVIVAVLLLYFPPIRWLMKYCTPKNPSYSELLKGSLKTTNVTSTISTMESPTVKRAQTVLKTRGGDAGYMGSAVMISECALALILSPREELLIDAHESRVLTPVAACGNVLVDRLKESGFFEISSQII